MDATKQHTQVTTAHPLLQVHDVALWLRKPRSWIYDAVEDGTLPAIRIGRQLRFDANEVASWIASRRVGSRNEEQR